MGFPYANQPILLQQGALQLDFDATLKLAKRQSDSARDFTAGERFIDMFLHDCLRPRNRSIRARGRLHSGLDPLLGVRRAMLTEQQVLGDFAGEFRIRLPADPGDHQVENGRPAGAGDPVTAAYIELSDRAGLRVVFLKADNVVPMHRHIVSVEEPRFGEYQAAVFDAADLDTEAGDSPEPADDWALAHDAMRIEARQDKHGLA